MNILIPTTVHISHFSFFFFFHIFFDLLFNSPFESFISVCNKQSHWIPWIFLGINKLSTSLAVCLNPDSAFRLMYNVLHLNSFTNLNFYTLLQFIKDITITIDKAYYEDSGRLKKILSSYSYENKTSCFNVRGKFEDLEKLVHLLKKNEASVNVVNVSPLVMEYIKRKCAEKLKKIQGQCFTIEIPPYFSTQQQNTVQVTFRTQSESSYPPGSVSLDFVKQRFITFYQRTASDLQVAAFTLNPHDKEVLQRQFPFLLFQESSSKTVTVIGPFANLNKLKAFVSQNSPKFSSSPKNRVPEHTPSDKSSSSLSKQSKHNEDEPCPICMEPIIAGKKETLGCKHSFCSSCLEKAFDCKPVCPICGKVYGVLKGIQPEGMMKTTKNPSFIPGYEEYGTIIIHYHIPSGIQKVRVLYNLSLECILPPSAGRYTCSYQILFFILVMIWIFWIQTYRLTYL